jgi:hypothetical protein
MAVAEDLHPDFLTPEHLANTKNRSKLILASVPDNEPQGLDELRLFFCRMVLYHNVSRFAIENSKKTRPEMQKAVQVWGRVKFCEIFLNLYQPVKRHPSGRQSLSRAYSLSFCRVLRIQVLQLEQTTRR